MDPWFGMMQLLIHGYYTYYVIIAASHIECNVLWSLIISNWCFMMAEIILDSIALTRIFGGSGCRTELSFDCTIILINNVPI